MTGLETKLRTILNEKETKILPENIKKDVSILGVTGTFTTNATATANDITEGKTAYVNGEKVTGTIPELTPYTGVLTMDQNGMGSDGDGTIGYLNSSIDKDTIVRKGTNVAIMANNDMIANVIGLTADKIVKGNSFLGVEGTAEAGSQINNQDKTITQNGQYTADSGYTGLGTVTVNVPSLDTSDATAEAIDLLYPKTAYTNGGKITGAMIPTYGTTNNITITQLNSHNVILHSIDINCSVGITNNNSSIDIYMIKNKNLILDSKVTYTISQLGLPSNIESLAIARLYTDDTHVIVGMVCSNNKMCSILLDTELLECSNTVISSNTFSGGGFKAHIRAIPNTTNQFVTAGPIWRESGYQTDFVIGVCVFTATATVQNLSYGQRSQRPIDNSSAYVYGLTDDGLHFTASFYVPYSNTQIMYTFSRATTNDNFTRTMAWGWDSTTYGQIYVSNDYYLYNGKVYDSESTEVGTFTGLNANFCMLYNIPDTNFFVIQNDTTIHTYKVNQDGTIVEFPSTITSSVARRWGEPLISEQHTFFLTNNEYESPHSDQTNIISITRGNITYTALIDANAESHDVLTGKKYYKNNGLHVGTMPNNGELNYTPSTEEQTIPAGYTSGGTVAAIDYSGQGALSPQDTATAEAQIEDLFGEGE